LPLKGAAGGLGIILQILDGEAQRGEEFMKYLRLIEFEAALLSENPNYDLDTSSSRNLVQETSIELMTAVINFFNSTLIYLRTDFFGDS
jgi:succinylglutamate desuccinylase